MSNLHLSSLWSTSLQDGSNSEDGNNLEAHMAKVRLDANPKCLAMFQIFQLNLDEEELIVMESCHSYIHDMLRSLTSPNQTVILRPWKSILNLFSSDILVPPMPLIQSYCMRLTSFLTRPRWDFLIILKLQRYYLNPSFAENYPKMRWI